MDIIELIKQQIINLNPVIEFKTNPNNKDLQFELRPEHIKKFEIEEARAWYNGDCSTLQGFYTRQNLTNFLTDPIYLSAKQMYFWAQEVREKNTKVTHSGLPYNIIYTMINVIGLSKIKIAADNKQGINLLLKKILDFNSYDNFKINIQEPYTLTDGAGGVKIDFDYLVSKDYPITVYYGAEDVEYVKKSGHIIAGIFKNYYEINGTKYLLLETRRLLNTDLIIEHFLFTMDGVKDQVTPVSLNIIEQFTKIPNSIVIKGINNLLFTPCIYFPSDENDNQGRSFFKGAIDIFDDLDQIYSILANTVRASTPIEYIPEDMCKKDEQGNAIVPSKFNRTYIAKPTSKSADGVVDSTIQVTQPQMQFGEFSTLIEKLTNSVCVGRMSPATLGIDLTKRDNASAQREKEKTTILTRNSIIKEQEKIDKSVCNQLLLACQFMHGEYNYKDYTDDISVEFNEFANPSYEDEMRTLTPLLKQKAISPERFMDIVYRNKLGAEDYAKELEYIKNAVLNDKLDSILQKQDDKDITTDNTNHLNKVNNDNFKDSDNLVKKVE